MSVPFAEGTILKLIAHLYGKGVTYATVRSKVSAISYFHKSLDCQDPTATHIVKRSLLGYKSMSPVPKSKVPLTVNLLLKLFIAIDKLSLPFYHVILLKSLLSLGFCSIETRQNRVVKKYIKV